MVMVLNYLRTLSLENKFLNLFPMLAIHRLLQGFNDQAKDLLINIFGLVLTNALGCVMINKPPTQLNIEPVERECLQGRFQNLSKMELINSFHEALRQLCRKLELSDSVLQNHMAEIIPELSIRLMNALENNCLDSIFISFKNNQQQTTIFQEGNKLEDERFRSIVDEIRECRYVSDKLAIIQKEIHSISDYMDILESYCIFDNEFTINLRVTWRYGISTSY
ncbi:DUF6179 domain-containing protein [Desulfosporosinus sp. BICA1-9]|uniref:DUF6179 domain-containing protein n=1 Tax=Desulfosporosinus sp. BICA1-9 TaxID=1531958 RepID=UPI000B143872|nr:DUF6179 domain-containing protein [Desulfosporosinus sp. BICA1-9]HBW36659.1 hypothetical protein [Desulfosporosinus sp.]